MSDVVLLGLVQPAVEIYDLNQTVRFGEEIEITSEQYDSSVVAQDYVKKGRLKKLSGLSVMSQTYSGTEDEAPVESSSSGLESTLQIVPTLQSLGVDLDSSIQTVGVVVLRGMVQPAVEIYDLGIVIRLDEEVSITLDQYISSDIAQVYVKKNLLEMLSGPSVLPRTYYDTDVDDQTYNIRNNVVHYESLDHLLQALITSSGVGVSGLGTVEKSWTININGDTTPSSSGLSLVFNRGGILVNPSIIWTESTQNLNISTPLNGSLTLGGGGSGSLSIGYSGNMLQMNGTNGATSLTANGLLTLGTQARLNLYSSKLSLSDTAGTPTLKSLNGDLDLVAQSGLIDVGGSRITDLATPVNNGDAANKIYVDTATSGAVGHEPIQTITSTSSLVVAGITRLNISGGGEVSIDPNIPIQAHMRIINVGDTVNISAPTGWSFQTGSDVKVNLGTWASAILSYYGDQVIIIDSQSPGVQS